MKARAKVNLTNAAGERRAVRVDMARRESGLAVHANPSRLTE